MLDMPATMAEAIAMLTVGKVVKGPPNGVIEHTSIELRECGVANRFGQSDWRLVWCEGLSLYSQCMTRGVTRTVQPCFYKPHAEKLIKPGEYPWAAETHEPGYYLIDFAGRWHGMDWYAQEDELAALKVTLMVRAPTSIVTEAAFAVFDTHNERMLSSWKHYGPLEDVEDGDDALCIATGCFYYDGWCVEEGDPTEVDEDYRVCVMRLPELKNRKK